MASAAADPAEHLKVDIDKIAAAYPHTISYYDVTDVENHDLTETGSQHPIKWVTVADWHDLAYEELLSLNNKCFRDLVNIEARVKRLLSQSSESAVKYEPLQIFLEECLKFLALSKDDLVCLSKNKCYMLMTLIESFVAHFDDSLSSYEYGKNLFSLSDLHQIPELQQQMIIKIFCSNPSMRSEPVFSETACQSEWVKLDEWYDLAHQELTSIRRLYLPQLFKAYKRVCGLRSESQELGSKYLAVKIFLLEYCKFLTLSRAEIVGLSKGECYVFMMIIKDQLWQQLLPTGSQCPIPELQDEVDIRVEFVDPSSGREPGKRDSSREIQPEWVVLAHQELESFRNMYSAKLDKIYKEVFDFWFQNPFSESESDHSTRVAVENALSFMVLSRAGIYDLSEEVFKENMRLFKDTVPQLISQDQCGKLQSPCRNKSKRRRKTRQSPCSQSEQSMNSQGNPQFKDIMVLFKDTVVQLISQDQWGKLQSCCRPSVKSMNSQAAKDSSRLKQFARFTNLNDQLYEEMQLMKKKYMPVLLRAYNIITRLDLKIGKHEQVRRGMCLCFKFLELPRCLIAVMTRDFYEEWMEFAKSVVAWCTKRRLPADYYSELEQSSFGYRVVKRSVDEVVD